MYLMKAKKQFDQSDAQELQEKRDKIAERQKDVTPSRGATGSAAEKSPTKKNKIFKVEELPDGACFRPKSVSRSDSENGDAAARPAEYIGSFSVSGEDQNARAEAVQKQLDEMKEVTKSKEVLLVISLSGVKVCSSNGESVYMAHALKRISYATCDPEFCQFSFLAREPKGPINVQFCHAFITKTSKEAEELNTIIGNAFKMAYAQERHKQPTFNELIEQQLIEQKAKFQEYQKEVERNFKQKLTEIATPTPFSEKAMQHMETRRQSSVEEFPERDFVVGKNKLWAKHAVEKTKHRSPATDPSMPALPGRSQSPVQSSMSRPSSDSSFSNVRISDPTGSAFKRISSPSQSSPSKNPSVISMRSFDNTNNSGKVKGSPVTALKDAIDRGYLQNGAITSLPVVPPTTTTTQQGNKLQDQEGYLYPQNGKKPEESRSPNKMVNRPLPAIPTAMNGYNQKHKNWTSMDDDVLMPHQLRVRSENMDGSPRRRIARPRSEVFSDKQLSNIHGAKVFDLDGPGCYMYQARSQLQSHLQYSASSDNKLSQQINMQQQSHHQSPSKSTEVKTRDLSSNVSELAVLRYQNDSPFQEPGPSYECPEEVPVANNSNKSRPGLESLMGLDRSHIEDEKLRHASWYQAGIPREIALEILQQEDIGSFIVRDSTTHPGCYALSVRVPKFENPTGISHYLILKTQRGVKLKGLDKEWSDLIALVTHHTVMSEMLPCTLRLPHKSNNPTFKGSDKDEKEEDLDYQRLSDFSSMMATLKM